MVWQKVVAGVIRNPVALRTIAEAVLPVVRSLASHENLAELPLVRTEVASLRAQQAKKQQELSARMAALEAQNRSLLERQSQLESLLLRVLADGGAPPVRPAGSMPAGPRPGPTPQRETESGG